MKIFLFPDKLQTSISVFQGETHFNNLHTELIIEVTHAKHLRPKTFASYREHRERQIKK